MDQGQMKRTNLVKIMTLNARIFTRLLSAPLLCAVLLISGTAGAQGTTTTPPPASAAPAVTGSSAGATSASPALAAPGGAEAAAAAGSEMAAPAAPEGEDLGVVYNRKLKGIEERVNSLKEKVFRSKSRLLLLRETVLHGVVSGAKAVLFHVNQLGSSYTLESVTYFLDGSKIYSRADASGDLSKKEEIKIFEGNIPPGNHSVTVNLVLRGNGFGVFSYLNAYKFKVQHSYNFIAEEGKVSRLRIISYEKNGLMRDFKDRPNIKYDLVTDRNLPSSSETGAAQ